MVQSLTRLQTLELEKCGEVQLPGSIVAMLELNELTMKYGGWLFSKQEEGEEKGSQMSGTMLKLLIDYKKLSVAFKLLGIK